VNSSLTSDNDADEEGGGEDVVKGVVKVDVSLANRLHLPVRDITAAGVEDISSKHDPLLLYTCYCLKCHRQ
jgi:hypothetical protein